MSTRDCLLACLAVIALFSPTAVADPPSSEIASQPFVSPSDWRQIEFAGNATFSDQQLRDALLEDPDFLIACHPHGKVRDLEALTQKLLVKGYRNVGFPDVKARRSETLAPSVLFSIDEGSRIRCGKVQVNGAVGIDAEKLTEWLTQPHPPIDAFPTFATVNGEKTTRWIDAEGAATDLEDPIWNIGKPVAFDSESKIKAHVADALKFLGFSSASAIVKIKRTGAGTAHLIVDVTQAGQPDRVHEITVNGLAINSRHQLLELIDVKVGVPIDRRKTQRMTERLWECGRFTKHKLQFDKDSGELSIDLEEFPGLPTLADPISKAGHVYLAARQWLSTIDLRGDDVELRYDQDPWSLRCVLSNQGMIIQVSRQPAEERDNVLTFMVDASALLLSHSRHPGKLAGDIGDSLGTLTLANKLSASSDPERSFAATVSFHVSSDKSKGAAIVRHVVDTSPVTWLPFAYKNEFTSRIEGSHLITESDDTRIKIDTESGEIVHMDVSSGEIRIAAGLFDAARKQVVAENRAKPNLYQSNQALTSVAAYLAEPVVWEFFHQLRDSWANDAQPIDRNLNSAVVKLVEGGLLALPDQVIAKFIDHSGTSSDPFVIPLQTPTGEAANAWKHLAAKLILKQAARHFDVDDDRWPWQVVRESCLMMIGKQAYAGDVLGEIFVDERNGPLCHATVACLLSQLGHPAADQFSDRALKTLEPEPFRRDYEALESIAGDSVTKSVTAFQSLTQDELEAIVGLIENETLTDLIRAAHANPVPDDEGQFWYELSKDRLQATLEAMRR